MELETNPLVSVSHLFVLFTGLSLSQIMGAITESGGFKGGETRVLVDSIVGFQALVDTGHISLLKVS